MDSSPRLPPGAAGAHAHDDDTCPMPDAARRLLEGDFVFGTHDDYADDQHDQHDRGGHNSEGDDEGDTNGGGGGGGGGGSGGVVACDSGDAHRALIRATAVHVVDLAARAHASVALKERLRQLLGLGRAFTLNLAWAEAWAPLQDGCVARMRELGSVLRAIYEADHLAAQLGDYAPPLSPLAAAAAAAAADNASTGKAGRAMTPAPEWRRWTGDGLGGECLGGDGSGGGDGGGDSGSDGDSSGGGGGGGGDHTADAQEHHTQLPLWIAGVVAAQPVVPAACAPHTFTGADPIGETDRECAYIHFLRLLALALDTAFQTAVRGALAEAGVPLVGGALVSGGVKSYERMLNKMQSREDHRFRQRPRPRCNVDVVRCLATFETAADMRCAFGAVRRAFVGGVYSKFKNGMAWGDERAAQRFHLRLVLATGEFMMPGRAKLGVLRADPAVQQQWDSYLQREVRPPSVPRVQWRRQAALALRWLRQDMPDDTDVRMHCEVQMLLRRYRDVRAAMHEPYKIVRAASPAQLHNDFVKYARQREAAAEVAADGDTPFKAACRDGDTTAVAALLQQLPSSSSTAASAAEVVDDGLCRAAKYVRPRVVAALLCQGRGEGGDGASRTAGTTASGGAAAAVVTAPGAEALPPPPQPSAAALQAALLVAAGLGGSSGIDVAAAADEARGGGSDDLALDARRVDVIRQLLRAKADPDGGGTVVADGGAPVYVAARNGHATALRELLQAKAAADAAASDGTSAVYMAAYHGHTDALDVLLAAKADARRPDQHGASPVYIAAQNGQARALQHLLQALAPPPRRSPSPSPPLALRTTLSQVPVPLPVVAAAVPNSAAAVTADADAARANGVTAAYMAAQNGHTDAVRVLLRARADPNRAERDGSTPAYLAAQNGYTDTLAALLDGKARAGAPRDDGTTAVCVRASEQ